MISNNYLSCDTKEFGLLSSELLRAGNTIRFRVKGASMKPLIRDGDVVSVAPLEQTRLHIGDVVLFTVGNGRALLHRVIKIRSGIGEEEILIQGDRSTNPDGYIKKSDIFGILILVERGELRIPADRFVYKCLGNMSSMFLRLSPKRTKPYFVFFQVIKKLPLLKKYLE